MRVLGVLVIILGIATLVFGILFIPQASAAKQKVADSLTAPVTLDTLDATYDNIDAKVDATPQNDPTYLMYFAQRTSLGLAKTNVGTARMVSTMGIINIIAGLGLVLAGFGLMRKSQSA
ncbi:MAG: hypothetical protein A2Y92_02380 [Chloroflexi bacterium RBG_13_57_8]|nr:MAG: hypothetical protein A2Y92_02380 [Chloroflexi bacterium RBG_13_57_8]